MSQPNPNNKPESRVKINEHGEKELTALMKEAGTTARLRKEKAMKEHFIKLSLAVRGTVTDSLNGDQ